MIKLIAIDLDGTLLNNNNEISIENAEAIKKAQNEGTEVTIATGRSYFDALSICKKAGIITHIISCNGSSIHLDTGEHLSSVTMDRNEVYTIVNWLEKNNFYYEVSTNKAIYNPVHGREILQLELSNLKKQNPELNTISLIKAAEKQFSQTGFVFVNNHTNILLTTDEVYNILAFSYDDYKLKKGLEYFNSNDNLTVFSSAEHNFEMVPIASSKGNALGYLSKVLNISLSETMAIGDNYNDISMLKKANYSVAMGNADDAIKDICKIVTHSNYDNGVAHVINQFIDVLTYKNKYLA